MGVTYKLKDEIVEFIIAQKKENPRLSCRGLVEIIQERFQLPVSKSSINSVIKNASLSNPIGRTPLGEKRERKYKIPVEKKHKFFPGDSASAADQQAADHAGERTAPKATPKTDTPRQPKPSKAIVGSVSHGRVLYDGIGTIFLKAAEWEISDKSILATLLEDNLKGEQLIDVNTGCDVLLYLELFGIKSLEELSQYHKQGLWVLHGLKDKLNSVSLERIIQEVRDLKKLSLKISYEIPQIFAHLQMMRLLLEDGTAIYLDAEMTSCWPTANVSCPSSVSLNQAIALISKQLLNNTDPCVFCSVPGSTAFAPEFYEVLAAFENLPGKRIKNISLLDIQQQEIAQFDTIAHQKRHLIAGVWPWQKEFKQIVSAHHGDWEKVVNVPPFKAKVYYQELAGHSPGNQDNQLAAKLRVILLRNAPGAAPYLALVTNYKSEHPAAEVVSSYLTSWPNEADTPHLPYVKEWQAGQEVEIASKDFGHLESNLFTLVYGIPGIWEVMHSLTSALNIFSQRHFFPPNYGNQDLDMMIENFYGLDGHLWPEGNFLHVKLLPPGNYLYKKDLEYAMRRVNEKEIRDPHGRRLIFEL